MDIVEVIPWKVSMILQVDVKFWLIENAVDLVILDFFTLFCDWLHKLMGPVDVLRFHQGRELEVLAEDRICWHDDSLWWRFVITFKFAFLFLSLKHGFHYFVCVLDNRSWEIDLIFNRWVFSGFDNPGFSLSCFVVLPYANINIETKSFEDTIQEKGFIVLGNRSVEII